MSVTWLMMAFESCLFLKKTFSSVVRSDFPSVSIEVGNTVVVLEDPSSSVTVIDTCIMIA